MTTLRVVTFRATIFDGLNLTEAIITADDFGDAAASAGEGLVSLSNVEAEGAAFAGAEALVAQLVETFSEGEA